MTLPRTRKPSDLRRIQERRTEPVLVFYDCIDVGVQSPSDDHDVYRGEWLFLDGDLGGSTADAVPIGGNKRHNSNYDLTSDCFYELSALNCINEDKDGSGANGITSDCFYDPIETSAHSRRTMNEMDGNAGGVNQPRDSKMSELQLPCRSYYDRYSRYFRSNLESSDTISGNVRTLKDVDYQLGQHLFGTLNPTSNALGLDESSEQRSEGTTGHRELCPPTLLSSANLSNRHEGLIERTRYDNTGQIDGQNMTETNNTEAIYAVEFSGGNDEDPASLIQNDNCSSNLTDDVKAESMGMRLSHRDSWRGTRTQLRADSNCNASNDRVYRASLDAAEDQVTEAEMEGAIQEFYKLMLVQRIQRVKETRKKLTKKANMLLTWNVIQLFFLLLMFVYAASCQCSFRKAFSCSKQCPRRNPKTCKNCCRRRKFWYSL